MIGSPVGSIKINYKCKTKLGEDAVLTGHGSIRSISQKEEYTKIDDQRKNLCTAKRSRRVSFFNERLKTTQKVKRRSSIDVIGE